MTTIQSSFVRALIAGLAAIASAPFSSAQCLEWDSRFARSGTNAIVRAQAIFDDGTGPALYLAGDFTWLTSATAWRIAKWDGSEASPLGAGIFNSVHALAVFDDGTGPALYAGGSFLFAGDVSVNRIAKWNGTAWSDVGGGMNAGVVALSVFDDGTGPALYAGGLFTVAGGASANHVAKWNGTSWTAVSLGTDDVVNALFVHDDGAGARLYAGGEFSMAGGASASFVASWNGTSWSDVDGGTDNVVYAFTEFDDGSGPALYAGGSFTTAGGTSASHVARWNGSDWSSLGLGVNASVRTLAVHDDGSGADLYAGGHFTLAGGLDANRVAKWDGASWSSLSTGLIDVVYSLASFDAGAGPVLYAGGLFEASFFFDKGGPEYVAKWDGSTWRGLASGMNDEVRSFSVFDDGTGPKLIAGGNFTSAGGFYSLLIAQWNGSTWDPLGEGLHGSVLAMATYDDGGGAALYAGGAFQRAGGPAYIARWNGSSWSEPGVGVNDHVYALAVYDDGSGPALYAGGRFTTAGGATANRIAKWNGTSWSTLDTGMAMGMGETPLVFALHVFDDGTGSALYAGGIFSTAGGVSTRRIAKWNGTSWSALGTGITSSVAAVFAITDFDDGTGSALYAGGTFTAAGGASANHVAKWNGSAWSALGTGISTVESPAVSALATFDDGAGLALYVGGEFPTAGGVTVNGLGKWDGATWTSVGGGVSTMFDPRIAALSVFDDGSGGGADLYAGGAFTSAGGLPSSNIAAWRGCGPGLPYCFGDGIDPVVTAMCPCANFGDPGHGCANTFSISGGLLEASGTTSPNTVVFTASSIPNNNLTVGFRNTDNASPGGAVFGDGVRCQSGSLFRFGAHKAGTNGDLPNTWTSTAMTIAPGLTRYYQVQYRNQAPAFCPPATFNITNGYRIAW